MPAKACHDLIMILLCLSTTRFYSSRNGRNDSKQKFNTHCEYCDQDGQTWKYCWEIQATAKKARRLKEMDDRDDDPSDTFNSLMSEDLISDDDLDEFIRNFSDKTELN